MIKKILYTLILYCFSFISNAQDTTLLCGDLVSITVSRIDCYNDSGFIDITYINPGNTYSYKWYDTTGTNIFGTILDTNKNYVDTSCGVYTLIVYDNNMPCDTISKWIGCPLNFGFGYDPIPCWGDSGTLKRPVFGGTKFDPDSSLALSDSLSGDEYYLYTWISADDSLGTNNSTLSDTTENLVGIPAGWYKTIVIDAIGCSDTIEFGEFKDPPKLILHDSFLDSIMCNEDNTSIELQIKGGRKYLNMGYFYYLIQDADTVAFSDSSGQSINFNILGSSPSFWIADTISITNLFSNYDSLQIHVIDSFGCVLDSTIFIPEPDSIVASINMPANTLICTYDSALISLDTIFGGTEPYTFFWNNDTNLTDSSVYVNGGFNRIYVIDANGCLDSTNGVDIVSYQDFNLIDSLENIDCFGESTGKISLQITGGTLPLSYTWDKDGISFTGGPSDTIKSNLLAGNYRLVIEDANQCVDTSIFILSENPKILLNPTYSNPTCLQSDGFVKVSVIGGVLPYTYLWQPTGNTSDSVGGLQAGIHTVNVTDSLGCFDSDTIELFSSPPLSITFNNYNDSLCYGGITDITANISGGTTANGSYTILWDNGETTNQTVLSGGLHQVWVRDDVGCEDSLTVFIFSPDSLSIFANKINPSCVGNDGSIDVMVSGGTLPYRYYWSTGDTGTSISNLSAGFYSVTVYDNDTCGSKDTLIIVLDPYISTLSIDSAILTNPSCANNDGEIDVIVSGGFPPYTYSWNTTPLQTTNPIMGLDFGHYTVFVTDSCGSTKTATYTLNQQQNTVSATGSYDFLSLWAVVSVNGSNPPFSIFWDSISMTGDSIQGLCEDNYSITVTDSKNCVDTLSIDVFYNVNQLVSALTSTVIDTSWGLGPFSYLWSNGQTTAHADSLCEGYHSVTVTANGGPFACPYTRGFTIYPMQITLNIDEVTVNCDSDFDGKIIADLYNNVHNLPYSFLWSTGDTIDRIEDGLSPGTYTINVLYNNGCIIDTSITIEEMLGPDCIPNVFSPNGDNVNDVWELEDSFLYKESTIKIYGRFGKKMYESIGYDTPWDGKNKKGKDVPDGAYFYSIILKGGVDAIRGTVIVIR